MEWQQKKSNKGKTLSTDARRIVYRVLKYFEKEKNEGRAIHPVQKAHFRSQLATGLPKMTICKLKKEGDLAAKQGTQIQAPSHGNRGRHRKVPVDNIMLTAIREIISSTDRKNVPSLTKLTDIAKKQLNFKGSLGTMRRLLKAKLGFRFKKCSKNRNLLLERSNIIAWRVKYLRRIRSNDALGPAKRPVIFLGETLIEFQNTESEGEETATDQGAKKKKMPAQRWVIAHAGSEQGFLPDACLLFKAKDNYCDAMKVEQFTKYIAENVIPNLPPHSIVVMDNSPYHSNEIKDVPTTVTPKCTIQEWLYERDIHYDEDWTKAELLQVVRRNKPEKTCLIDNMFAEHGHEVLRLPPYNCDLNAIEYIWNLIKKRVSVKNVDRSQIEIKGLLKYAISTIKPSDWSKEVNHVKRLENQYWIADVIKEHELEDAIIEMGVVEYDSDDELQGDHKGDEDVDELSESDEEEPQDEEDVEELQDEDHRLCSPPGIDTGGKVHVPKASGHNQEGYRCHECRGDIVGVSEVRLQSLRIIVILSAVFCMLMFSMFNIHRPKDFQRVRSQRPLRYCCVECRNWELCAACEARARHAGHCVLRVPSHKEHLEVCAIIQRIHNQIKEHQRSYAQLRLRQPNVKIELDALEDPLQENPTAQQLAPSERGNRPVMPAPLTVQSDKPVLQSYRPVVKPWPTLQLNGISGKQPVFTVHTHQNQGQSNQLIQPWSTLHRPVLAVKSYTPEGPQKSRGTEEQSRQSEEKSETGSSEDSQSELEESPTDEESQPTRRKIKKYVIFAPRGESVTMEDKDEIE